MGFNSPFKGLNGNTIMVRINAFVLRFRFIIVATETQECFSLILSLD